MCELAKRSEILALKYSAMTVTGSEDVLNSISLSRLDFKGRLLGKDLELGRLI